MIDIEKLPKKLTEGREHIECAFIFSLFKDPTLIDDYSNVINGEDIITPDGMFYYGLLQGLDKAGYHSFDNLTIETYLIDKQVLREGYERRGGYKTIVDIKNVDNEENIEGQYEALTKSNIIIRLYERDFPVLRDLDKLSNMNSEEIFDYYDYQLTEISADKIEKTKSVSLSKGYEPFVQRWKNGEQIGFPIALPMLNKRLLGTHRKNIMLHCSGIGNGKTTTSLLFYVLPVIEQGDNVLIIGNEQGEEEFRNMILSSVVFNKIGYLHMNRSKITEGGYNEEQEENLQKAWEWLGDDTHGNIEFVELSDYSIIRVKKMIKKYAKLGYGLVLFDTLKPEKENSDKAWAEFSEATKQLFQIAKKEKIALIATAQLTPESMQVRYLDLNCIGKSKAIAETATQVVMFRFLFADEKEKLKPYTFKKTEDGKWSRERIIHNLDPTKNYIVIFTPKNRFGDTKTQIVVEFNPALLTYKEVGWIEISPSGYNKHK